MSYVQGTTVRVEADFENEANGQPIDPGTVVLIVRPPTGALITRTLAGGGVINDPAAVGRFYSDVVADVAGTWHYQFASGDTVERSSFIVRHAVS
jgi:hypothetical protein